jgi:hypothetical protein
MSMQQTSLTDLEAKHRLLEDEISDLVSHPGTDDLKIHELKRKKLQLKDEITKLKTSRASLH